MERTNKKMWLSAAVGLSVLGMLVFGSVETGAAPQGFVKEAIHWNISADELDPATGFMGGAPHLPLYLFHDALVKIMPEGIYTPSLAESWTISPDAKVFEFKLRKGVNFHNGDALTAEDA